MAPKKKVTADAPEGETLTRIAIVNQDRSVGEEMHVKCFSFSASLAGWQRAYALHHHAPALCVRYV